MTPRRELLPQPGGGEQAHPQCPEPAQLLGRATSSSESAVKAELTGEAQNGSALGWAFPREFLHLFWHFGFWSWRQNQLFWKGLIPFLPDFCPISPWSCEGSLSVEGCGSAWCGDRIPSLILGSVPGPGFVLLLWHNPSVLLTTAEPVVCLLWVSAGSEAAGEESVSNGFIWTTLTFPVCLYQVTVSSAPLPCFCGL